MRQIYMMWAGLVLAGVLTGCLPQLEGAQCSGDLECSPGLLCNQGVCAPPEPNGDLGLRPDSDHGGQDGEASLVEAGRPDLSLADLQVLDHDLPDLKGLDLHVGDTGRLDEGMSGLDAENVDVGGFDQELSDLSAFDQGPSDRGSADHLLADEGFDEGLDEGLPDRSVAEAGTADAAILCLLEDGTQVVQGQSCTVPGVCRIPGVAQCRNVGNEGVCEPTIQEGSACGFELEACASQGQYTCMGEDFLCDAEHAGRACNGERIAAGGRCAFEGIVGCDGGPDFECLPIDLPSEPDCDRVDDDCDGRLDEREPALNDRCDCANGPCTLVCKAAFVDVDRGNPGCERGCDLGAEGEQLIAIAGPERVYGGAVFSGGNPRRVPVVVTAQSVPVFIPALPVMTRNLLKVRTVGQELELTLPLVPDDAQLNNHGLRGLHTHLSGNELVVAALIDWGQNDVRPYLWRVEWNVQRNLLSQSPPIAAPLQVRQNWSGFDLRHITAFDGHGAIGVALVGMAAVPGEEDVAAEAKGKLLILQAPRLANAELGFVLSHDAVADPNGINPADQPVAAAAIGQSDAYLVALWRQRGPAEAGPPKAALLVTEPGGAFERRTLTLNGQDELPGRARLSMHNVAMGDGPEAIPLVVVPTSASVRLFPATLPFDDSSNHIDPIAIWPQPSALSDLFAWRSARQLSFAVSAQLLQPPRTENSLFYPHGDLVVGGMPSLATFALPAQYQSLEAVGQTGNGGSTFLFHRDGARPGVIVARELLCR